MFCMSCGGKLKDNSKFCGQCGQKIKPEVVLDDKQSVENQQTKDDRIPPVIPLTQHATTEEGEFISKKVKPLTYALMAWVKRYKGLQDTIDIADDEDSAEWHITYTTSNDKNFEIYINTNEVQGIISLFIYYPYENVANEKLNAAKEMILEINNQLSTGKFQLVGDDKILRYLSGINVSGIASEDPEYTGDHLISPKLIDNMFDDGIAAMENFIEDFSAIVFDAESVVESQMTNSMFSKLVDKIIADYKADPRSKIFVDEATLLASAKEETGVEEISSEALRDIINKYINGDLDDADEQSIYDGAVYACGVVANNCFGNDPDEEVDYELSWIQNTDDSFSAEVRQN